MKKYLLLLLGVLLIAAGVYFLTKDEEFEALKSPELPQAAVVEEQQQPVFTWRFVEEGEGSYGDPKVRVFVSKDGIETEVGVYQGFCSELKGGPQFEGDPYALVEGQLAGVLCWWAGAGDEIGVFKEGNSYVIKTGVQGEGDGEHPHIRSGYTTTLKEI